MKKTILFLSCLFLVCALAGPMPAQEKKPSGQSGKTSQRPDDNNEKRIKDFEKKYSVDNSIDSIIPIGIIILHKIYKEYTRSDTDG